MMERAQAIKPGETCVIIAPFEPIPLYDVLRAQGFPYETQQVVHNEWVIRRPCSQRRQRKRYAFITPW